jgi:hypothetical protein
VTPPHASLEGCRYASPIVSTFRWIGIVAVGVALANATVFPVDQHFAALILCDPARDADRLALGFDDLGRAFGAGTFDGPSIGMGYDVLVAFVVHCDCTFEKEWSEHPFSKVLNL